MNHSLCGRLPVLQTVLKLLQFGIKTLKLCELSSGYLWSFIAHVGITCHFERYTQNNRSSSEAVWTPVPKGYKSPGLVKFLTSYNASCMGTLKINRKSVPKRVKEKSCRRKRLLRTTVVLCGPQMEWQEGHDYDHKLSWPEHNKKMKEKHVCDSLWPKYGWYSWEEAAADVPREWINGAWNWSESYFVLFSCTGRLQGRKLTTWNSG